MKRPLKKDHPLIIWLKKHAPDLVGAALELYGKMTGRKLIEALGKLIKESNDLTSDQKAQALLEINK